ncbi:hypothetical protein Taro_031310 [Colocasia esculenta]|uniref:Uncharacterized protein n=1 Tax=Colocasia esculenta TaxID=4460 RepID=A0A843VPQ3_COLES|nr:hypothetical protein [Colocasia esculenta]
MDWHRGSQPCYLSVKFDISWFMDIKDQLLVNCPVTHVFKVFAHGCEAWWADSWAQSAHKSCACERNKGLHRVPNAKTLGVTFTFPLFGGLRLHGCRVSRAGQSANVGHGKVTTHVVAFRLRWRFTSRSHPLDIFKKFWPNKASTSSARPGGAAAKLSRPIWFFGVVSPRGRRTEWGKQREFVFFTKSEQFGLGFLPVKATEPPVVTRSRKADPSH